MLLNRPRLEERLAAEGLDAVVLATPINVAYGAGFASEFLLGRFEDWTTAVVLARDPAVPPVIVMPEFDLPYHCEAAGWIEEIQLYGNPWSSVGAFMGATLEARLDSALRVKLKAERERLKPAQQATFFAALEKAIRDRGLAGARLACDDLRVAARLEAAGLGGNQGIADALWTMRRVRIVKTPDERAILTAGAAINAEALDAVIAAARPGLTEADMVRVYRERLTACDARWLGERGMMFGPGDASSFSLPEGAERRLDVGDAIVLDCLGTYRGYHMDLARTGVIGEPSPAQQNRFQAVLTALEAVEAQLMRPGADTQEVRTLVRSVVKGFGLRPELVSVTTHALGLEVFEFPHENALAEGFALEEGMVVNTEVFYRDPELGAFHLEDSVAIEQTGCAWLHPGKRELVVIR